MCGIVGAISGHGRAPSLDGVAFDRWRDELTHRGPDAAGSWHAENVSLGHRRLAIRDTGTAATQPFVSASGRQALVFNGELYADRELRGELAAFAARQGGFRTSCDAETAFMALLRSGVGAIPRLRGIYALAWVDLDAGEVLLARDPLGVKPLVYTPVGGQLLFASEPKALLAHPAASAQPDLAAIVGYLALARREIDGRTLFEGVRSVRPGEVLRVDLRSDSCEPRLVLEHAFGPVRHVADHAFDEGELALQTRAVLDDSIRRQLASDVPVCSLLSGGIDSSIIARVTTDVRGRGGLETWCAGAVEDGLELGPDMPAARRVADAIGTRHSEARIDRAGFLEGWRAHVVHLGQPLSTPNEIAISEVARHLRSAGNVVALSGEGADELFGGYDAVLASLDSGRQGVPALTHLETVRWTPRVFASALFGGETARVIEGEEFVRGVFESSWERAVAQAGPLATPLDAHLRMQRALNLTTLLERLDAATMRHGVEGRTPFADEVVARFADGLPIRAKFMRGQRGRLPVGKVPLRTAFANDLPRFVLERPKAAFPLPFQRWAAPIVVRLTRSPFARSLFLRGALEEVARDPERHWRLAWPLANIALWGDHWWGRSESLEAA